MIICHGRILSVLSNNVCRIFCHTKTACDMLITLDQRYATAEKGFVTVSINEWFDSSLLIITICLISFIILKHGL